MKTIVIVGVGALGSHVVQFIRSLKGVTLRVIDFDRVESKNTLSQFHGKPGTSKLKVESLRQTMAFLWGSKMEVMSIKVTKDNLDQALGGSDLIVDCLDNGASRRLLQQYARAHKAPCIHGGLAADGSFGRIIWDEHFAIDDEPSEGAATCENGEHLPFIALTSAYLARSIQLFIEKEERMGFQVYLTGAMRI